MHECIAETYVAIPVVDDLAPGAKFVDRPLGSVESYPSLHAGERGGKECVGGGGWWGAVFEEHQNNYVFAGDKKYPDIFIPFPFRSCWIGCTPFP